MANRCQLYVVYFKALIRGPEYLNKNYQLFASDNEHYVISGNKADRISSHPQAFKRKTLMTLLDWTGDVDNLMLAIVFTDIVKSTVLANSVDAATMKEIRARHYSNARRFIKQYNGHEVKPPAGDSFFVVFHTATAALNFAVELYSDTGDARVLIRTGIHVGEICIEDNDCQGLAVNLTQRVMKEALNGGIVISGDAYGSIMSARAFDDELAKLGIAREVEHSGFEGKHRVHYVRTRDHVRINRAHRIAFPRPKNVTVPLPAPVVQPAPSPEMLARFAAPKPGLIKNSLPLPTRQATDTSHNIFAPLWVRSLSENASYHNQLLTSGIRSSSEKTVGHNVRSSYNFGA